MPRRILNLQPSHRLRHVGEYQLRLGNSRPADSFRNEFSAPLQPEVGLLGHHVPSL